MIKKTKVIKDYVSKSLSKEEVEIVDLIIADSVKKFITKGEWINLRKPIGEKYYDKMEKCSKHMIKTISAVFDENISDEECKQIQSEAKRKMLKYSRSGFIDMYLHSERLYKTICIFTWMGWKVVSIFVSSVNRNRKVSEEIYLKTVI